MKLFATTYLVVIIGAASATLPPGYEDQIWCPKNTCEIYTNPYGITGADSSLKFCYHPSTGKTRKGIWTGSLTMTVPPANAIQPQMCTSEQYTECQIDDDCKLEISPANAGEMPCTCYVSSMLHPFIPALVDPTGRNAKCDASVCNERRATCDAGTCQIDFTTGSTTISPAPTPSNTDPVSLAEVITFEEAEDEEYVVDSGNEFNAFIAQPASGNTNSLQCTWQSSLEKTSNHKQACQSLSNDYTEPYTCDGNHKNICCTVSNIVKPKFDSFGTCSKNGVAANPNVVPAPVPTPLVTPTLPKPASGNDSLTPLKCNWSPTFASFTNHKQACIAANDEYTVPYTCDGEYTNICCTVSGITNPTFDNKKFGTCLKNGTTSKPTSKPTTRKTGYNVAVAVE